MIESFIHGFILAFGLILPLGAQNVFIFNQGANQPTLIRAVPAIITASLADTLLISLAVLGVSVIVLKFVWLRLIIMGIGFFFLLYMGWVTWKSTSNVNSENEEKALSVKQQIVLAASASLLNPHAILDTIGVIGTSSMKYVGAEKWSYAIATILVSWVWFILLAVIGRLLGKFDQSGKTIMWLNKISAIIIWGVAIYIGRSLIS